jgi:hypothetical protein
MWVQFCKDLFYFHEDVYFCFVYIPPHNSIVLNQFDIDFYEEIEIGIEKYKGSGKIMISGDLNSRTSNCKDFIEYDRFINDELLLYQHDILQRVNKDKLLDLQGKKLLSLCTATNLIIANGRLSADRHVGEYTFHSNYGSSTVDYLLLSYDDFVFVTYFKVEESNEFSDHSALTIHIERKPTPTRPRDAESSPEQRIKWDDSRINLFRAGLLNKRIEFDTLTNTVNYQNIDNTVTLFTNLINENAMKVFGCTKNYRHNYNTGNKQANKKAKWFDQTCYNARKEFKKKRNLFMRNKTDENRKQFIDEKKKYNRLKKLKKTKSSNDEKFKLTTLAKKEPKQNKK